MKCTVQLKCNLDAHTLSADLAPEDDISSTYYEYLGDRWDLSCVKQGLPVCYMCKCFEKYPHHYPVSGKCLNSTSASLTVCNIHVVLHQLTCGSHTSPMLIPFNNNFRCKSLFTHA